MMIDHQTSDEYDLSETLLGDADACKASCLEIIRHLMKLAAVNNVWIKDEFILGLLGGGFYSYV